MIIHREGSHVQAQEGGACRDYDLRCPAPKPPACDTQGSLSKLRNEISIDTSYKAAICFAVKIVE